MLERFRPEFLLTYGGHPLSRLLMRKARATGTAVVFHLHKFSYHDRRGFEDVDAIIFPRIQDEFCSLIDLIAGTRKLSGNLPVAGALSPKVLAYCR